MDGSRKSGRGAKTISIDPVTRIEGHLKVEVVVDGGRVKEAECSGTLFRGFENILVGRYPVDAVRLVQRVCGVCPVVHGSASAMGLDEALGVAGAIPENGRIVRNLILGSNYLQSHILHFFTLTALDFVDMAEVAGYAGADSDLKAVAHFLARDRLEPFVPRYEGDYRFDKKTSLALVRGYLEALRVRRTCHEMLSVFGGKMPHEIGIVPGGVTAQVTADKVATFLGKLQEVRAFIDDVYVPAIFTVAGAYGDYFEIGAGCRRFLSYGVFNLDNASTDPLTRRRLLPAGFAAGGKVSPVDAAKIAEEVACSRYADECAAAPAEGKTVPQPSKHGAYSWLKAPRYDGAPAEVGPLARAVVGYMSGRRDNQERGRCGPGGRPHLGRQDALGPGPTPGPGAGGPDRGRGHGRLGPGTQGRRAGGRGPHDSRGRPRGGPPRRPAQRPRPLGQHQGPRHRPLPTHRADHLERLAAR